MFFLFFFGFGREAKYNRTIKSGASCELSTDFIIFLLPDFDPFVICPRTVIRAYEFQQCLSPCLLTDSLTLHPQQLDIPGFFQSHALPYKQMDSIIHLENESERCWFLFLSHFSNQQPNTTTEGKIKSKAQKSLSSLMSLQSPRKISTERKYYCGFPPFNLVSFSTRVKTVLEARKKETN